jgi:hypothetical protein
LLYWNIEDKDNGNKNNIFYNGNKNNIFSCISCFKSIKIYFKIILDIHLSCNYVSLSSTKYILYLLSSSFYFKIVIKQYLNKKNYNFDIFIIEYL